jgi:hypothetical protein
MQRKQFTFYRSYFEATQNLSTEQMHRTLTAIVDYALNENLPEDLDPVETAVFTVVRPHLDSSRERAEKRLERAEKTTGFNKSKSEDKSKCKEESESKSKTENKNNSFNYVCDIHTKNIKENAGAFLTREQLNNLKNNKMK